MPFVASAGAALARSLSPPSRPCLGARTRPRVQQSFRRPRRGGSGINGVPEVSSPVRAVFLPRNSPPRFDDEESPDKNGSESEDSLTPRPVPEHGANRTQTTYWPRQDSIDRVLEEGAAVEYDVQTWVSRNERRALSTVRGRSERSIGADELNESLRPSHLERHRYVLEPDEAFGAIFSWDAVVANSRELELRAWSAVARERGLMVPDMNDIVRAEDMPAEKAVERIFYWTRDWGEIKQLCYRKAEVYEALVVDYAFRKAPGLDGWLVLLSRYGVKCVLAASRPRELIEAVISDLGLSQYFKKNEIVAAEDEFDTLEQMFLFAAMKAERPPEKCVIFTDRPPGIAAGHEVSAKVVALIGAHPAYEMKTADGTIASYDNLVVYNIRRLFSEAGMELMDPQTELERGR